MANVISNPSFETDTAGWDLDVDYSRTTLDSYDGSASILQSSVSNFANFNTVNDANGLAVVANNNYYLSFWNKVVVTSGSVPIVQINVGSAFGSSLISTNVNGGTNWTNQVLLFNTGANTKVWVRIFNNNGNVVCHYDLFIMDVVGANIPTLLLMGVG